jgi:hypothetical protein
LSQTFSIADLPVVDDLNVPVDPTEYADQANPAPPAPGNYRFAPVKVEPKTTKEGKLVLVDGKFPIINLAQVKIVVPVENERGVGVFQDIRTKPGTRKGRHGQDVAVNDFYDLLRSFDATVTIDGFEHAKTLLQQYLGSGATFVGQLGWQANDYDYVEAQFALVGATTFEARKTIAKDVANNIYNKARKRTKDFVVNGKRQSSILGPSGQMLEARPVISRFYPSHVYNPQTGEMEPNAEFAKDTFFGPFKK